MKVIELPLDYFFFFNCVHKTNTTIKSNSYKFDWNKVQEKKVLKTPKEINI